MNTNTGKMTKKEQENYMEQQLEGWLRDNPMVKILINRTEREEGRVLTTQEKYALAKDLTFASRWGSNGSLGQYMK